MRLVSDVTYPIVAYMTVSSAGRCGRHRTDFFDEGHEFHRTIWKAFYDLHIEDVWLRFFCNTTNITTPRMQVHETGYA